MRCPNCDSEKENVYNIEVNGKPYFFCYDCGKIFEINYLEGKLAEEIRNNLRLA